MTLFLTLASAVTASSLSTAVLKRPIQIDRPWTPPRINLPHFLARCSNANIDHIEFTAINAQSATYQVTVYFKNLLLADSSSGQDSLTCTLYSTLPEEEFGGSVSLVNLFHASYTIASNVPSSAVTGSAEFGVGIIESGNLTLTNAHELHEGSAPSGGGESTMARMKQDSESDADLKRLPAPPSTGSLIRVASTSFGGGNARGLAPGNSEQTIQVDLTQPHSGAYQVDSNRVIVNQISLSLKGTPGVDGGASVQLKKVAILIQSMVQ